MANITLLLREGYFLCPESGEMYTEVSGRFTDIRTAKYKGFTYWSVGLSDGCDEMRVLLQLKSSAFAGLVLSLVGCKFRVLTLQPYLAKWNGKEIKKLSVYVDGGRYSAPYMKLPQIRRVRDGKGKPWHCDYSERLKRLAELAGHINTSNAHV